MKTTRETRQPTMPMIAQIADQVSSDRVLAALRCQSLSAMYWVRAVLGRSVARETTIPASETDTTRHGSSTSPSAPPLINTIEDAIAASGMNIALRRQTIRDG